MEVLKEIAEGAARDMVMFKALSQIEKDSETVAEEMVPQIVGQWRGNFRSAYGSADKLGIGQYQTNDKPQLTDGKKPARTFSIWPFRKNGKSPAPANEANLVAVDAHLSGNGNGAKPQGENPT